MNFWVIGLKTVNFIKDLEWDMFFWLHRKANVAIHVQGILQTRHCPVEVISIIKENPAEEVQANS